MSIDTTINNAVAPLADWASGIIFYAPELAITTSSTHIGVFSVGLNYSNYKSTFNTTTNTSWKAVMLKREFGFILAAWNGWVEEHNISSLGIPIIGRYKYQFNPKWSMMAGAGFESCLFNRQQR